MNTKNFISGMSALMAMFVFLLTSSLFAGDPARTGTAGGVQVQIPVGAKSLGVGGANIASVKGMEALFWNPAGLASMGNNATGTFSTMKIFNDINVNYIAIGAKAGRLGSIGFSLKTLDVGEIPITTTQDMFGASGATFAPTFFTLGLTYSKMLTDVIQVGFTGKFINESVSSPNLSSSATAFDAGIQYRNLGGIGGLGMGLAVKNIGSDMKYTGSALLTSSRDVGAGSNSFREVPTQSSKLPATIELGVSYMYELSEENNLNISGNFRNENFGNDGFHFGAEYSYNNLIALRGGYLMGNNIDSADQLYRFTLGVGLHTNLGNSDLHFDYAFRDSQYFDGNNMFALTIGF